MEKHAKSLVKLDNSGYAAIVSVFLVITIGLVTISSISSLMSIREKITRNSINSIQSYYAAESAIEDTLLRVMDSGMSYEMTNTLILSSSTATVVLEQVDNTLVVTAMGDKNNFNRSLQVQLEPETDGINFNYGIQTGQGGVLMKNNSAIVGNLYSGGDVVGVNAASSSGDVFVSGPTGKIDNFEVGGDAHAHTIKNSEVGGDAYYQHISGSTVDGVSHSGSPDPEPVDMSITQEQIDEWKEFAEDGGEIGDYEFEDGTASLGPVKINGDLTLGGDGNDVFTLTGVIWVTGDVIFENNGILRLSSGYGNTSGMISLWILPKPILNVVMMTFTLLCLDNNE